METLDNPNIGMLAARVAAKAAIEEDIFLLEIDLSINDIENVKRVMIRGKPKKGVPLGIDPSNT